MSTIIWLSVCMATAAQPTESEVRAAVSRSLPYLESAGLAWWEEHKCVSCHHGPMLLFSHNEARRQGIQVDADELARWTDDWVLATARKQPEKPEDKRNGGGLEGMAVVIYGRDRTSPAAAQRADDYADLLTIPGDWQHADGYWEKSQWLSDESYTRWMLIAAGASADGELPVADGSSAALNAGRLKASAWLETVTAAPPAATAAGDAASGDVYPMTEDLVTRLLYDWQFASPDDALTWRALLASWQNDDGGWGIETGGDSHMLITGEVLYALAQTGATADDSAIVRARQYLLDRQTDDGHWHELGRARGRGKENAVYDYWTTGWAAVGLARSLGQ